jgi:hypothetical protein
MKRITFNTFCDFLKIELKNVTNVDSRLAGPEIIPSFHAWFHYLTFVYLTFAHLRLPMKSEENVSRQESTMTEQTGVNIDYKQLGSTSITCLWHRFFLYVSIAAIKKNGASILRLPAHTSGA